MIWVRIPCTTSRLEKVVPTWQSQRHQGPFLHLGHHAFNILVRIQVIIIKVDAILTGSHPNGEISLGAYGEVLPHWTLDSDVFQSRVLSGNVLEKFWMAGHGRSPRPPTPYLAKTDPKNIARAEDENASETLLLGSLPRPYHALQHELVPVASRESHWWLPILFPVVFFGGLTLQHTQASYASQSARAAPESSSTILCWCFLNRI